MNRELWTRTFSEHHAPPWPCPACARGTLALVKNSLAFKETVQSQRRHSDEDWFPEETDYAFTAWLQCREPKCGQQVVVAGDGSVEAVDDGEGGMDWDPYFVPRYCYPMPDIIQIPRKCPKEVKTELHAAFALSLADRGASAGRLRVALERLMDTLGVQKRQKKDGKLVDLKLHHRIELLQKREPATGAQLMALKWLGNVGSHEGGVKRTDLLDAFEILEHSLAELIDRRTAKVAAMAKALTKKYAKRRR